MKKSVLYFVLILVFFMTFVLADSVTQSLIVNVVQDFDIVINEFESNPIGTNSGNQWVELYNNDSIEVNISGWKIYDGIGSGAPQVIFTIPSETIISSKSFYTFNTTSSKINSVGSGDFLTLTTASGAEIDKTPTLVDTDNDNLTWQRIPDVADNWIFKEETKNFTNNVINIENKTTTPSCIIETDNVTLSVNVTGSCIEEVIFSVFLNDSWINFTGTQAGDIYSREIQSESLPVSKFVNWTVYVSDCSDNLVKDENEAFKINSATHLEINPPFPIGLNGWYLSEPEFTLINPDGNISYRWNGNALSNYTGPFGLEETPNDGNVTGGIHVLKYGSDVCEGEKIQNFTGRFDFTNPLITNLTPEDGSTVFNNVRPMIHALLDEVYQSNSGIDKNSVLMILDGVTVPTEVIDSGEIDAVVRYDPDLELEEGLHIVNLSVIDNSGRQSNLVWNFTINTTATGFEMVVNEPEEKIYDSTRVPFNLTMTKKVIEISYINHNDNRPREKRLCRNCNKYGEKRKKTKTLREGYNNLTFSARDEFNNLEEKSVELFIDSKNPKIKNMKPKDGFAFGNFSVEFDELNPSSIVLNYGNSEIIGMRNYTLNISEDCVLDRMYKCSTFVDLSDYDGQKIKYFFNLTDIAGNDDQSKTRNLKVDMTDPIINSFNLPSIDGKKVNFVFDVTEINFDKITYIDNLDGGARKETLCRRLNEGICEKKVSFKEGEHEIDFEIIDKAGNSIMRNSSFFIDSKKPNIRKTEPKRGFASGEFFVEFREENPVLLILNYGNLVTGVREQVLNVSEDCTLFDRDYKCQTLVNLTNYQGQEIKYWFKLTDIAGQSDTSTVRMLEVDVEPPVINSIDFELDRQRVRFILNITEENFNGINYIDWNDRRPREKRLCSRLRDGICEKRKSFRTGEHNLTISVLDEAGNFVERDVEFLII